MNTDQNTKQLFRGAFLLSVAGLLGKIISAGYRIPLQNLTGDLGFYIYQQIYPIIGISLMLALYGFPAAISKLKAEQQEKRKILSFRSFYGPILFIMYGSSSLIFLFLYTQADLLADWMGDSRLADSLQTASFVFLFIPLTSLLRGAFQGSGQMAPTAGSQIAEQLVRVLFILSIAVYVAGQESDYYLIGKVAALGAITGMVVAFVYLWTKWRKRKDWDHGSSPFSWSSYSRSVLVYGLFLCCVQMVLLLIQFADAFTLVPGLIEYGIPLEEARLWKGVLDRGQPLIQLGTVLGSSLALVLIPSITQNRLKERQEVFYEHVQSAWKVSFVLSAGAATGLIAVFPYANRLLYQDAAGTGSLRILMIAVLMASLVITSASFLQGLGFVYQPALFVIAGIIVKFLLNAWLVPAVGLAGGAWATVISLCAILVLNLLKLRKETKGFSLRLFPGKAWFAAAGSMILWIFFLQSGILQVWELGSRLDYFIYILLVSVSGAGLYLMVYIRMNGFTKEELISLPGGKIMIEITEGRGFKNE